MDHLLSNLFPNEELEQWDGAFDLIDPDEALSVSELILLINATIDEKFSFLWIKGEISNLRQPSSGHLYFTIKDEKSQIKAVMFRSNAIKLNFDLEEGQDVLLYGRINVYGARGDLQLIVQKIIPAGIGALQFAFEQLKQKLYKEGLFDEDKKLPLPLIPESVFVITSPTGAALHDFIKTARSRFPRAKIILCPSKVQGEDAPKELILALKTVQKIATSKDVIVFTRGGGSIEDLWAFNDEDLAYEIFKCKVPIVSAVGHEIDFTICDFVADRRAATPTAAAQLIFPQKTELLQTILSIKNKLDFCINNKINQKRNNLSLIKSQLKSPEIKISLYKRKINEYLYVLNSNINKKVRESENRLHNAHKNLLDKNPINRINLTKSNLKTLFKDLKSSITIQLTNKKQKLYIIAEQLDALSPLKPLKRGYSLVYKKDNKKLIRSYQEAPCGTFVSVVTNNGSFECKVTRSPSPSIFKELKKISIKNNEK